MITPNLELRQLDPLPLHEGTYFSQALQKEQPYAYFAPQDWDGTRTETSPRYPLLVLLHGRNSHYNEWAKYTRVARYAAAFNLIIAFPEGANGWYTNALDGSARYEDDLTQDFLPHLQQTLPLQPPGKAWGVGGLSMGGYGAVKLALKRPDLFLTAMSHSGALERHASPRTDTLFGDPQKDAAFRRAENVYYLAEQAMTRFPAERPFLYLDCGSEDKELIEVNRRYRDHLHFLGYPFHFEPMPGQHTWPYWDRALRTTLPKMAKAIGATFKI